MSKKWIWFIKVICFVIGVFAIYKTRIWLTKISCFIIGVIKIIFINLATLIVEILQPFIDSGTITVVIALITAIMGYYFNKSLKNRGHFLEIRKELAKKQIESYNALEKFLNDNLEPVNIDSPVICHIQRKNRLINAYPKVFGDIEQLKEARKNLAKLCNESFFESSYIDFYLRILQSYMDNYLMIYNAMEEDYKVSENTIAFFARIDIYEVRSELKKGINYFYKNTKGKNSILLAITTRRYVNKTVKKFEEKKFYIFLYWKLWKNKEIKENTYKKIIETQKKSLPIINNFNLKFRKMERKNEVDICKECRYSNDCDIKIDTLFLKLDDMVKDFNEYKDQVNNQK
ncbi:MAG: hypothetical protein ACK5LY_09400 [Lachnospirales bacterium]